MCSLSHGSSQGPVSYQDSGVLSHVRRVCCHCTLGEQKRPAVTRITPLSQRDYRGHVGRGLAMKARHQCVLGTRSDGGKKGLSEPSAALPLLCASCSASTTHALRPPLGTRDTQKEILKASWSMWPQHGLDLTPGEGIHCTEPQAVGGTP